MYKLAFFYSKMKSKEGGKVKKTKESVTTKIENNKEGTK